MVFSKDPLLPKHKHGDGIAGPHPRLSVPLLRQPLLPTLSMEGSHVRGRFGKNINPFLIMMKIYTFLQGGGAWVHRGDRLTNPPTFGY